MKRIVFLLKRPPMRAKRILFAVKMRIWGIKTVYRVPDTFNMKRLKSNDSQLLVTDDRDIYAQIRKNGSDALIYLHEESELGTFDAKYFVLDAEETEREYFERVYRRINNIPWEIAKTKRLILRETTEDDVDEFVPIYADPRMTEFTEGMYEAAAEKEYITQYRRTVYACQGFGVWTVIRKKDRKIIGRAGLSVREGFEGVEVGFAIGCDYQGVGYATEAVKKTVEFAAKEELKPVNALVMERNTASKRVLAKCGFSFLENVSVQGTDYELWQIREQ